MPVNVVLNIPEKMWSGHKENILAIKAMKNLMREIKDAALNCHYVCLPIHQPRAMIPTQFQSLILVSTEDLEMYPVVVNKLRQCWGNAFGIRNAKKLIQVDPLTKENFLRRNDPGFASALEALISKVSCMSHVESVDRRYREFGASPLPARDKNAVIPLQHRATRVKPDASVGPNGYPVGYARNGDKVEWIPDEDHPGKRFPFILCRSDKAIGKAYAELREKTWWHWHQSYMAQIHRGEIKPTEGQMVHIRKGIQAAKKIEKKYGRDNLLNDPYNELLHGRVSALAWVMGTDWESSGDL
jgi:hypothetical protein